MADHRCQDVDDQHRHLDQYVKVHFIQITVQNTLYRNGKNRKTEKLVQLLHNYYMHTFFLILSYIFIINGQLISLSPSSVGLHRSTRITLSLSPSIPQITNISLSKIDSCITWTIPIQYESNEVVTFDLTPQDKVGGLLVSYSLFFNPLLITVYPIPDIHSIYPQFSNIAGTQQLTMRGE